jgi:hypothetical protein
MLTATIEIGFSSSRLRILDADRRGPSLNLIWGHGCDGDGTPRGRADVLLAQCGYRRVGDWQPTDEGDTASVDAGETVRRCSCWWGRRGDQAVITAVDYWCAEHPRLRGRPGALPTYSTRADDPGEHVTATVAAEKGTHMDEKITLRLVERGESTVEVDRAEYEQAKADDDLTNFLDAYASDIDSDWWVVEPDGTEVRPTY